MTTDTPADAPFWRRKTLAEMSRDEWESLCDGCGRCCLVKLEDEEDGSVHYTKVVCSLLDQGTCKCTHYHERSRLVPSCLTLTPGDIERLHWMPSTCAYRRLAEGHDLAWWHPLVSGDPETVHAAGISVRGRCISETRVADEDLEDHIVDWPA